MADWDGRGLVSTAWLGANLADPDLRVFDVTVHLRPSPGGGDDVRAGARGRADLLGSGRQPARLGVCPQQAIGHRRAVSSYDSRRGFG